MNPDAFEFHGRYTDFGFIMFCSSYNIQSSEESYAIYQELIGSELSREEIASMIKL
jgi:hypothetical protein